MVGSNPASSSLDVSSFPTERFHMQKHPLFLNLSEAQTAMKEFFNPPCRFCRAARITGVSLGALIVLFLIAGFVLTR